MALLGAVVLIASAAPPPASLTVPIGGMIDATIDGAPARLIMTADGLSYPVLAPGTASRLALGHSMFSVEANVGPVRIPGQTGVITLKVGDTASKRRALWFDKAPLATGDGQLGPESTEQPVITFSLRAPIPGERTVSLPLARKANRVGTIITANGMRIFVQFSPQREASLATASAASMLAVAYGGVLQGKVRSETVRFGVQRPVRTLTLSTALLLGPLRINRLDARIADYGSVAGVADEKADPAEIVVVATKGKNRSEQTITIGSTDLARCSNLTVDKGMMTIRLTCAV